MKIAALAVGLCLSPAESELIALVNAYRAQHGLPSVPTSRWLSTSGQWKVWDRYNNPSAYGNGCSPHSWSNGPPLGVFWSPVCWTGSQSFEMWWKPKEISNNIYTGNGFELTADAGGLQTPALALSQWQNSPAHNTVILNQGLWSSIVFHGIGVGMGGSYAVLWFGDQPDPSGPLPPCDTETLLINGFE